MDTLGKNDRLEGCEEKLNTFQGGSSTMKKTLVAGITTALVMGAMSTTFAATNPFSDVPADHWAYDAVAQLAQDGVIEGYGDGTFAGDKAISRYEMAQMVAKAMAKKDVNAADKATIDKLAAEFADELGNLGVRVSNLEKHADMVKFNGTARVDAVSDRPDNASHDNESTALFRLEPTAEVNDNWSVKARLDAKTNVNKDTEDDVTLKRVYAEGDYGDVNVKVGKFAVPLDQTLMDSSMTGASVTAGTKTKVTLGGGRWSNKDNHVDFGNAKLWDNHGNASALNGSKEDTADYLFAGVDYTNGKVNVGTNYHYVKSDVLKDGFFYHNDGVADNKAEIVSAHASYDFDGNVKVDGTFAENLKTDGRLNKAGGVEVSYKGAQAQNAGTWGVYTAYRYLGGNTAFAPFSDGLDLFNVKGWEVGASYAPFKNIVASAKYFDGKDLNTTGTDTKDTKKVFGRVEFLF